MNVIYLIIQKLKYNQKIPLSNIFLGYPLGQVWCWTMGEGVVVSSLQNSKSGDLVLVQGNLPSAASERKSSSYSNHIFDYMLLLGND